MNRMVAFRIKDELYEAIQKCASEERRTMTDWMRLRLEDAVEPRRPAMAWPLPVGWPGYEEQRALKEQKEIQRESVSLDPPVGLDSDVPWDTSVAITEQQVEQVELQKHRPALRDIMEHEPDAGFIADVPKPKKQKRVDPVKEAAKAARADMNLVDPDKWPEPAQ